MLRGTPTGGTLVTNGDFASGTGWSLSGGWSISGGVATHVVGTTDTLSQAMTLTDGKTYRVTYTVSAVSGSLSVQPRFTGGTIVSGTSASAAGTVVTYMTALAGNNTFAFVANSAFGCSIDNVEIVDVSAGSVQAPYALQFDGVDDFLQTASVNFTATDKMTVCHGVRKLSDAATGVVVELSANIFVNAGAFNILSPSGAFSNYQFTSGGTVLKGVAPTGYAAPITNVLTGLFDISGDRATARINGAQVGEDTTDQGTGNFGNYALYFGRRGTLAQPYNGLMFSAICVGKAVSATELANIERWTNQRTGAY